MMYQTNPFLKAARSLIWFLQDQTERNDPCECCGKGHPRPLNPIMGPLGYFERRVSCEEWAAALDHSYSYTARLPWDWSQSGGMGDYNGPWLPFEDDMEN
jgi:hypothetical protein